MDLYTVPICYEPKRNHRFIVTFPKELGIEVYDVQRASLPKYENKEWQPMYVDFINFIGSSLNTKIQDLILSYKDKHFEYEIESLDPTGTPIDKFKVYVKEFSVDFGNLDYADDDLQRVKLKIIPDNVVALY